MSELLDTFTINNDDALAELAWAIEASEGRFTLLFARCNYTHIQKRLMQRLQELCTINIRVIHLKQSEKTLYATIREQLGQEMPSALMISGLESVLELDKIVSVANQVREEFRKNFPFPLVLWMNDEIHHKFIKLAPDFESWGTTTRFAIATDELIDSLHQGVDSLFTKALAFNSSQSLYKLVNILDLGFLNRSEFELALKDLQNQGYQLEPKLTASLQFIQGLNTADTPQALHHFQNSLNFWQQEIEEKGTWEERKRERDGEIDTPSVTSVTPSVATSATSVTQSVATSAPNLTNPKLKAGLVLFHIGLYYYRIADRQKHRTANWKKSQIPLQECIKIFEQENRPDLVAKCITQLERVLQRIQAWDELEQLAKKAITLHQTYESTNKLAQDYGFLAETALQQKRWIEARQAAEQAEHIIAQLPKEKRWFQGLNLLFLSQAERQLGEKQSAIAHLVKARDLGDFGHPKVYIRILEELRELYLEEKHYLEAFTTKQLRLSVEQQYGIRAFIGAGRLQPHREESSVRMANQETVAPEIIASGRQRDLERLLERIGRNDCKLIVIHGFSGVGKSSLVNAGVVPALKQRVIGIQDNLPVVMRVYTNWMEELAADVAADLVADVADGAADLVTDVTDGVTDLADGVGNGEEIQDFTSKVRYRELLIERLRENEERNLRTVLIFDQFEEFFFTYSSVIERRLFWEFLGECLQILSVKVILSLREDYLHYLLEGNRLESMSVIGHDILGKNVLYGLGNFSPIDARAIIEDLTTRSRFYLEPELIDELVKDLAGLTGEVLPIELQVVGAQLQAEGIKTLVQYRELGTKEELVRRYLAEVVSDCGVENRQAAELVLYLLTDEKGTRPLKTRVELERDLEALVGDLNTEVSKLDFILRIFVESGLVLLLPEKPANRYQLVHDYLSVFIRQQQELGLVAELAAAKEKQRLTEAQLRQVLKEKEEALQKEQEERKRAEIAEIEALNSLSQVLWLSDKQLEALLAVVKAAKKLQHMADLAPSELKRQIRNQFYQTLNQVRERNCLEGHSDTVYSISFSPDGQMIASASGDGTVKLWELDGTLLHTFQANRVGLYSVSFSPDGQTIISAGADGILKLWKLDGTLLHTFEGHGGGTYSVNFSPNGQVIASAGDDGAVKIWKLDGTLLHTFEGHTGQIYTVCFSPDGHTIASANADGIMKLWQFDGQRLKTFQRHLGVVTTVTFSPDGQTVASASPDGTLKLWNIDGMRLQTIEGYREAVKTVSFSPDGQMIASASADGTVKVWGVDGALLQTFWGHSERVYSVSFSPDLQKIASASADGRVKLWHFEGAGVQEFQGRGGMVWSVCFSPDGRMIASANYNNTVKLWRLDGTVVQTLQGHTDRVLSVCFSPNGQMIASASRDHTVKLWSLDGTILQTLQGHTDRVSSVCFSPNGQMIASASRDHTVKLWSLDGTILNTFQGHKNYVFTVSFSPDGQMIASASTDGTVKLWYLDGKVVQTFQEHKDEVYSVSFSPDGQMIASASADNTVKLWGLDGKVVQTFEGHSHWVYSVTFSPNGQMIASASADNTVKLWGLDGKVVQTFEGHSDRVLSVCFSPDGQIIASASRDCTVKLWNLNLDDLLIRGCNWLRDYLKTNPNVSESDRTLCDDICSPSRY